MKRTVSEIEAVEGLYTVFGIYEFAADSVGCAHCVAARDEAALRSTPLRALTADQLRCFALDAPDHWGTLDDYRHFLPRILDVVLDDDLRYPDLAQLMTTLARAGWREWPADEQRAIERYATAKWARLSAGVEEPHRPAEMLTAWSCAGFDLRVWLDRWLADATDDGLATLAYFVCDDVQFPDGSIVHGWWPDHVPKTIVADWLVTPATANALEHATGRDEATAWTIRAAIDLISYATWAQAARARA